MAFDMKGKQANPVREELRVLSTQIEAVNQQLAAGVGAGGVGEGPALGKAFADLNAKLAYIYEFLKTMQVDLREDAKTSYAQVEKSTTQAINKNLADLYAANQETVKTVQSIDKRMATSPVFNTNDLADIKQTLQQLVGIYREEVEIFKRQNDFLQKKLIEIEQKLDKRK